MTEESLGRHRGRKRLWLALAAALVLLAVLVAAPMVSLNRYKGRIAQLMAASLGRPVRLSSVELRMLPRPGFVLSDLTVEEDPAYGAEPVLHASTVSVSIRLLSLLSGRLEISRISVDDASLNLVRTSEGRWNLDSLFRTAAAKTGAASGAGSSRAVPLPYLEATNSRINIKSGLEKLPYSLVDTDVSFWQEEPGRWRIRLRGQPERTDVIVQGADTGLVRLEASVRRAAELRELPIHLDLDWRDAQLGQLARLVTGSDPGWRGDLTGELHLDGTPDAAHVQTRLRATGVHRAEFAPASPMDFDANCGFTYHYSAHGVENLQCDSPLGDGHVRVTGEMPGDGGKPHFSVELDRISVAVGLDALRTVRSGFGPGLEATGTLSGKLSYDEGVAESGISPSTTGNAGARKSRAAAAHKVEISPLTGSIAVERLQLSGDGFREPIAVPRIVLEPVNRAEASGSSVSNQAPALAATVALPAGAATPLAMNLRLGVSGYELQVRGQAALARARVFAHMAGMGDSAALDMLAGDSATLDLSAAGPWMESDRTPFSSVPAGISMPEPGGAAVQGGALTDRLTGTVTLHNANWKADYLANHVEISQAVLHLDREGENGGVRWDPLVFSYGGVKGTASLVLPGSCAAGEHCPVHFAVQFGALDAAAVQAAILGAHEKGTLLSELIARLSPSTPTPSWPELEGTVTADSLILGSVKLEKPTGTLRIAQSGAEITGLDAGLLGGVVHGFGTLAIDNTGHILPKYALTADFSKLNPSAVGPILRQHWSGGAMDAGVKVELSGFTDKDLAASAKGDLHFEWRHGVVAGVPGGLPARFDRWSGDAEISNGSIALKDNQLAAGGRTRRVDASVKLENPPSLAIVPTRETQAKR